MNANLKTILTKMEMNEKKTRITFYKGVEKSMEKICDTCKHCKKGKDKDRRVICRHNRQPKLGSVYCHSVLIQ